MLPHYSPFKVAETFALLSGLFPGRIDLGLGRAAGTDPRTSVALQRDRSAAPADDFPQQLVELLAYFECAIPPEHPFARQGALFQGLEKPEPWLLGSSAQSAIWAAQAAMRGAIAGLVTAPLHKEALAAAGVGFPGHTELLQAQAAAWLGKALSEMPVRMMLANDELRTVLVSIHLSLRDALQAVTFTNVLQTIRITHQALSGMLGRAPRIGVAGLNPHAGEGGLFGREEIDIIGPAIAAAQASGIAVEGPFGADTMFHRTGDDAFIVMVHDQGHIAAKLQARNRTAGLTIGTPVLFSSVAHGSALDIAGKNLASLAAVIEAVQRLAGAAGQSS